MNIPANNQAVMPYLILKDVRKFIDFTVQVFGGKLLMQHFRDDDPTIIMHAEIDVHGSTIMCAEALEAWPAQPAGLFVYVENADESFALAKQLGATVVMEPADREYGRACGIKDICGNTWWITSA